MGRFADVAKGTHARCPATLPLPGATCDPKTGEWVGAVHLLAIRVIHEEEHLEILAGALRYAKSKGVEKPTIDDPIYERALMVHTLAVACVDKDSPENASVPYFDSVAQILGSEVMTPEVVGYLFLKQQTLQDETSPLLKNLTNEEFLAAAIRTAAGDLAFFVNSRPGMQWSFMRTLASRLVASLADSSRSTPSSPPPETTNESPAPSE